MEERNQRRIISWKLGRQVYRADEPGATAPIDREPYLVFSSYSDWQTIGRQFLQEASPMSETTPKLTALAEDITRGIADRRDQARAIHDWVSKNVRYFAIFLGQGGFVPHSAESVLANKYGDCKDHATLMRALLAAKGIEADYALISQQPIYQEPRVASPDWFNHVILWLPEFDEYDDPTASSASFANLPDAEADKTVLRAGNRGVALAKTPPLRAEGNRLTVTADVTLSPDGMAKGTSTVVASGPVGAQLRGIMTQVALRGGDVLAKELLARQNWRGTGNIEARPATDHTEPFAVRTSFDLSNKFLGDAGNRSAVPVGPRLVAPAWIVFDEVLREKRTQNFTCKAEVYEQIIDFHLPDGQVVTNIPNGGEVKRGQLTFESRYELREQTLHIERRAVTRVPGQSCSAQSVMDMVPALEAAEKEFGWTPQFKRADASPEK
jgi:hypothetical protein